MNLRQFSHKVIYWEVKDFFCVIRCFQCLTMFLGYGYIRDYRHDNCGLWIKIRGLFFTIFWLAYFVILIQINLQTNYFETMSSSLIANVGRRLVLIFGLSLGIVSLITSYLTRARLMEYFKKIIKFDTMCQEIGMEIDFKYMSFKSSLFTICSLMYNILVVAVSVKSHDSCQSPRLFFYMHVPLYVTSVIYLSFIHLFQILMFVVINRFNMLNDTVWELMYAINSAVVIIPLPMEEKSGRFSILKYAKMHEKLVACVEDISYCFTVPLMFTTAGTFGFMITTLFVLFRTYGFGDISLINVSNSFFLWCIFFTLPIIVNIFAGSTVANSVSLKIVPKLKAHLRLGLRVHSLHVHSYVETHHNIK